MAFVRYEISHVLVCSEEIGFMYLSKEIGLVSWIKCYILKLLQM